MGQACGDISSMLCLLLITTGVGLLVMWLTAQRHRPVFYITDFSLPNASQQHSGGLAKANLGPVRFAVAGHNPNKMVGVYCREMTASVYHGNQLLASGLVTQPSFYLAPKADTTIQGELNATGRPHAPTDPAWEWFAADVSAGSVAMRLLLESRLRFKGYRNKHRRLRVECDFRLGEDGNGTLLVLLPQDKYSWCGV